MQRRRFIGLVGRGALQAAAGAGALAGASGLRRALARVTIAPLGQHPLRPPGALPEGAFRTKCTGCLLCGEVCSAKAIRFPNRIVGAQPPLKRTATSEHGASPVRPVWAADSTPYILPWDTACSVCLRCGPACPTGALRPIPDVREQIKKRVGMGVAHIDRKICLPWTRISWCGACLTICPFRGEAITVDYQSRPTIHAEHCIGCGLCVEVCPIRYKAVAVVPPFYPDQGRVRAE